MNSVNPSLSNILPITQNYNSSKKAPPPSLGNTFQVGQDYSVCKPAPPPQTWWERFIHGARDPKYCTEQIIEGIKESEPIEGWCWGGFQSEISLARYPQRGILVNRPDSITAFVNFQCGPIYSDDWGNIWFRDPNDPLGTIHPAPPHKEGTEPR
jgi:hypothetical protein